MCASRDAGRPTWYSCTTDSAAVWNPSSGATRGRSGCNDGRIGPGLRISCARIPDRVRRWSPWSRNVRRTCRMLRASRGRSIWTIRSGDTSWGDPRTWSSSSIRSGSSTICCRTNRRCRTCHLRFPSRNPRPPSFPAWKMVNGLGHPPQGGCPGRLSLRPSWS